jgi:flagellar M-ring protein FliF
MDFLNRAYSQLNDLYRSMTPGSRLTAGLLAVVVVVSMGYLFMHEGSSADVDLMHGVPIGADQLRSMEAALGKANLKTYEIRGTSIYVPRGEKAAYMGALAAGQALPRGFGDALRDAINKDSPFVSNKQRDQLIKIAIQDELALWIRSMSGIESAYVLYDVDIKPGFIREKQITATACVKPAGGAPLDEARVSAIRHLVAGGTGAKPENVTVSDLNGRTWYGNALNGGGSADDNLYVSLQRIYEQDLKAKILNALCFIPNVTVEPTVVLDRERISRVRQVKRDPPPPAPRDAVSNAPYAVQDANSGGHQASGGQPANVATALNAVLGGNPRDDAPPSLDSVRSVSGEQVDRENVGLTPKLAKVSVGVPVSYFKNVWQQRRPAGETGAPTTPDQAALDQIRVEESAKIQRHVAQLLPPVDGVNDAMELVTVTTFQDLPAQELPLPSWQQNALTWLGQYWGTLATLGLSLVGLLVLRSVVRGAAAGPREARTFAARPSAPPAESAPVPAMHGRRRVRPGNPSGRDELSEVVQQNPDTAANILRTWIGNAG